MAEKVYTNCTNSGPVSVYVKDGKITRIRPLVVDEKDYKPWVIEAGGKKYSPPKKVTLSPYIHAERRRIYSDERIKYPMKRVDFDPNGERNPQNRGKSRYERISWDEAATLVASELTRVKETYGGSAISGITSSHHNWGIVGYKMGPFARFLNMVEGTPVLDNPDSWEGWHWGATHTYGFQWRLGMPEPYDMLGDALQNAEMIVYWSNDPDTTRGTYSGQDSALWRQWLKEKGVKMVFIDPFYNYTNAVMGGKWIAPRPGTDTAMAMAIAFVWITEDTYNKDYVANRTIGFDEFKKYVLGETDGVPKTPEWAAEECGVEARVIRTLAREWAAKRTILSGGSRGGEGGACRQAYATEWARMMVLLQAMQGLGAPGRSIWGTTMGAPNDTTSWVPSLRRARMAGSRCPPRPASTSPSNPTTQRLWRLTVPDAILDPPVEWYGEGFCGKSLEQQFTHFVYPAEGCSEIKLWYRYGGSFMGTMSDTTKWVRMYQSPKLEFVVNQDIWYNSETRMADVILPACTNFERDDIGEWAAVNGYTWHASSGCNYRVVVREQKCIEPLWESKSDYEIFALIFEKMGLRDRVHRRRQDRGRLGQGLLRHLRPAQGRQLGGVQPQGLSHHQHQRRLQAHAGAALVLRRPALRHARRGELEAARPRRAASWAPSAARSSSRRRASSSTSPTTTSGRWCRATSAAGRGTDPRALRQVSACSSCRRIRGSRSTATTTSTPTG